MKPTTAKVNTDYTLTRPKRLRKFEKVDGVKTQAAAWQEPEKIERPVMRGKQRWGRGRIANQLKTSPKSAVEVFK